MDELELAELEIERAYSMLEAYGVPRERAGSVSNGISVLMGRIDKERQGFERRIKMLEETYW